jgi:hypothetical protein
MRRTKHKNCFKAKTTAKIKQKYHPGSVKLRKVLPKISVILTFCDCPNHNLHSKTISQIWTKTTQLAAILFPISLKHYIPNKWLLIIYFCSLPYYQIFYHCTFWTVYCRVLFSSSWSYFYNTLLPGDIVLLKSQLQNKSNNCYICEHSGYERIIL